MKIQPTNSNLLVSMKEITPQTKVILPDNSSERQVYGEVLAVGPNAQDKFKVGDRVLFLSDNTIGIKKNSFEAHYIVDASAVFATYEDFDEEEKVQPFSPN